MIRESEARVLLERLVRRLAYAGEGDYRTQLVGITMTRIDDDGSFSLTPASPPESKRETGMLIEAEAIDIDGFRIDCLLHARDGLISELEFVRLDGEAVKGTLRSDEFVIEYP